MTQVLHVSTETFSSTLMVPPLDLMRARFMQPIIRVLFCVILRFRMHPTQVLHDTKTGQSMGYIFAMRAMDLAAPWSWVFTLLSKDPRGWSPFCMHPAVFNLTSPAAMPEPGSWGLALKV